VHLELGLERNTATQEALDAAQHGPERARRHAVLVPHTADYVDTDEPPPEQTRAEAEGSTGTFGETYKRVCECVGVWGGGT
jgi:hypothetical protein